MSAAPDAPSVRRSAELHEEARRLMPGGVNSPVRAFGAVGGVPRYVRRAKGAWIEDEDGHRLVDFCCSWGALILGHAPDEVLRAAGEAAAEGMSYGAPSRREIALARRVTGRIPSLEMVRFVSSGTEAVMSAVRLARAATGRELLVKFEGCYHGHSDALLVKGGSGLATFGTASSAGVPAPVVESTAVLPLDDERAAEALFAARGGEIALLLIEPVPANAGLLLQRREFLLRLRELCDAHGALLLFDEVISGFRVGPGGAAAHFGITPDLVTYGKILGGGMPAAAFGGRRELMERLAPLGPVYQAGTLSGNPVAMAAGEATLRALDEAGDAYARLESEGRRLEEGILAAAAAGGWPLAVARLGSLWWIAFQEGPAPRAMSAIRPEGIARFARFHRAMLARGIYLSPSGWEVGFLTLAHAGEPVDRFLAALAPSLAEAFDGSSAR